MKDGGQYEGKSCITSSDVGDQMTAFQGIRKQPMLGLLAQYNRTYAC